MEENEIGKFKFEEKEPNWMHPQDWKKGNNIWKVIRIYTGTIVGELRYHDEEEQWYFCPNSQTGFSSKEMTDIQKQVDNLNRKGDK